MAHYIKIPSLGKAVTESGGERLGDRLTWALAPGGSAADGPSRNGPALDSHRGVGSGQRPPVPAFVETRDSRMNRSRHIQPCGLQLLATRMSIGRTPFRHGLFSPCRLLRRGPATGR